MLQVKNTLLEVVYEPAGRANQDIDTFLNFLPLFFIICATKYHLEAKIGAATQNFRIFKNLYSQFAGWCEHDRPRAVAAVLIVLFAG